MAKTCRFKKCKAACCGYISVYIDPPRTKRDFDEIRWFTAHENVAVYKGHDTHWIVEFTTPCKNLDENYLCRVYDAKPDVCSIYHPDGCTFNTGGNIFDGIIFRNPEDVDKFLNKKKKKAASKKKAAGKKK